MSSIAIESQCSKTICVHVVDKRDFILSDHKTCRKSVDCDFACTKLASKCQLIVNANLAERVTPYFS